PWGKPVLQVEEGAPDGCSAGFSKFLNHAMGAGINLTGGCFDSNLAHIFMVQEATNMYTGAISDAWPRDWFADHKSPFPTLVNWNVLADLSPPDNAWFDDYSFQHGPGPADASGTLNDPNNKDKDPYYVNVNNNQQWDPQELIFRDLFILRGWQPFQRM